MISIEELDWRNYGKDDEPKLSKAIIKLVFPSFEQEVKNFFNK